MREGKGFRILLSIYSLAWLTVLLGLFAFCESLSYHLGMAWQDGEGLTSLAQSYAIPMIGGLGNTEPPRFGHNWVSVSIWAALFAWPVASVVYLWVRRDPDAARCGFVYSAMGYGIFFFAVLSTVAFGLAVNAMY